MSERDFESRMMKVYALSQKIMPKRPYHNFDHADDFYSAVTELGQLEKVSLYEQFLLRTAGLLHDVGYSRGEKNHEENSVLIASQALPKLGYKSEEVKAVSDLIRSTKIGYKAKNLLEEIMHDADLHVVGTEDFFEASERLRIEKKENKRKWNLETQLSFLNEFKYLTKSANELWGPKFRENMKKLRGGTCS